MKKNILSGFMLAASLCAVLSTIGGAGAQSIGGPAGLVPRVAEPLQTGASALPTLPAPTVDPNVQPNTAQATTVAPAAAAASPQPLAQSGLGADDASGVTPELVAAGLAPAGQLPAVEPSAQSAAALTVLAAPLDLAAASYAIVDVGPIAPNDSILLAVNNAGVALGESTVATGQIHAFLARFGQQVDMGSLGGAYSRAAALNGKSQATGWSQTAGGADHAYIFSMDRMIELPTFGGASGYGTAINPLGQVAGFAQTPEGLYLAFLYSRGLVYSLGTLGGSQSYAEGINRSAQVCGVSNDAQGNSQAFLWSAATGMQPLGFLGTNPTPYSNALYLNDAGQVAGFANITNSAQHAFLWQNGVMTDIGTLGGANSYPAAINSSGLVVGGADLGGGVSHAFQYANGAIADLGYLVAPANNSGATHLNTYGQVVGYAFIDAAEPHAVVWNPGAPPLDLNTFVTPTADWDYLAYAAWINDAGVIVGYGVKTNGDRHGFVAVPQ